MRAFVTGSTGLLGTIWFAHFWMPATSCGPWLDPRKKRSASLASTDVASVGRAVDAAAAKAGRIDVAVNNAGYYLGGLAEAVTTEP